MVSCLGRDGHSMHMIYQFCRLLQVESENVMISCTPIPTKDEGDMNEAGVEGKIPAHLHSCNSSIPRRAQIQVEIQ